MLNCIIFVDFLFNWLIINFCILGVIKYNFLFMYFFWNIVLNKVLIFFFVIVFVVVVLILFVELIKFKILFIWWFLELDLLVFILIINLWFKLIFIFVVWRVIWLFNLFFILFILIVFNVLDIEVDFLKILV